MISIINVILSILLFLVGISFTSALINTINVYTRFTIAESVSNEFGIDPDEDPDEEPDEETNMNDRVNSNAIVVMLWVYFAFFAVITVLVVYLYQAEIKEEINHVFMRPGEGIIAAE